MTAVTARWAAALLAVGVGVAACAPEDASGPGRRGGAGVSAATAPATPPAAPAEETAQPTANSVDEPSEAVDGAQTQGVDVPAPNAEPIETEAADGADAAEETLSAAADAADVATEARTSEPGDADPAGPEPDPTAEATIFPNPDAMLATTAPAADVANLAAASGAGEADTAAALETAVSRAESDPAPETLPEPTPVNADPVPPNLSLAPLQPVAEGEPTQDATPQPTRAAEPEPEPEPEPEQAAPVALDAALDDRARAVFDEARLSGLSVAVWRGNALVYETALGAAADGPEHLAAPGLIGAASREFAAAAVMVLVEEGRVALSDPIEQYVPGVPNGTQITIANLLAHNSGVADVFALDGYDASQPFDPGFAWGTLRWTQARFAPGVRTAPVATEYLLLSEVVERASAQSYAEFVRASVIQPAGLTRTRFAQSGDAAIGAPVHPSQRRGWSDVIATPADMRRWQGALTDGWVLSPASASRLLSGRQAAAFRARTIAGQPVVVGGDGPDPAIRHVFARDGSVSIVVAASGGGAGRDAALARARDEMAAIALTRAEG